MTTRDIHDFLSDREPEYLSDIGVLLHSSGPVRPVQFTLNGRVLSGLIRYMAEREITRLVHGDWWLNDDGYFHNPKARPGQQSGYYANGDPPGRVFIGQNEHINPHFVRYRRR